MSGRAFLIVNPVSAGGATLHRWPRVRETLVSAGVAFDYHVTRWPGDAGLAARVALQRGFEAIVVVGGDGTVNEVVNGLAAEQPSGGLGVHLGMIPSGTGLDFARNAAIQPRWEAAAHRLANPSPRRLDLGKVFFWDGTIRHFVNSAGAGFNAEVAARAHLWRRWLKGTAPYVLALLLTMVGYHNRRVEMSSTLPGGTPGPARSLKARDVVLANGWSFGGGMRIAPLASLEDGLLDVVVVGDTGRWELLANLPRVYRGTHLTHPKVQSFKVASVAVSASEKTLVQTDGEIAGTLPATFEVLPRALSILV